jgi:hypothetical protein
MGSLFYFAVAEWGASLSFPPLDPRSRRLACGMTLGAAGRGNRTWAIPAPDTPKTHLSTKRSQFASFDPQSFVHTLEGYCRTWSIGGEGVRLF